MTEPARELADIGPAPAGPVGHRASPLGWPWLGLFPGFLAIAIAIHWPVRHGYFQVDDFLWLHLGHWTSVLDSFYGPWGLGQAYRPIMRVSYYLDYSLFGRNAVPWHVENVVLHALNGVLAFALLRKFRVDARIGLAASFLFLVAPLSAESVDWISGRTTVLCLSFMLLSMLCWADAAETRRMGAAAVAVAFALLGGMTYEAIVVLPALLIVLIPIAHRRFGAEPRHAFMLSAAIGGILVLFFLVRGLFLGKLTAQPHIAFSDPLTAAASNLPAFLNILWLWWGPVPIGLAVAAALLCLLSPRLRYAGPALLALAILLYAPYLMVAGLGGRFFYMLQLPLCVLLVLPACLIPRRWAAIMAGLLIVAVLAPGFIQISRRDSRLFSEAGAHTKHLMAVIAAAIPRDGARNVIDDVPDLYASRPMMWDQFEMAMADYLGPDPPSLIRSRILANDSEALAVVLDGPTHFLLVDESGQAIVSLTKEEWLKRHPELAAR